MQHKKAVLVFLFYSQLSISQRSIDIDSLPRITFDTCLTGIQNYRTGSGQLYYYQYAGSAGLAVRNKNVFENSTEFFTTGIEQFRTYEYSEKKNYELPLNNIFSQLKYFNGSKKEQDFSINHFQKFSKNISAGIDFRTANADGYYTKQKTSNRNFDIYSSILTTNKKYNLLLEYISNRIIAQENGGLINDSVFEHSSSFDSKVVPVNFNEVTNTHKLKMFFLEQQFNFFSATADSVNEMNAENEITLKHIVKYSLRSFVFSADKFYDNFFESSYYDTTATYDSLFAGNINNTLSLDFMNISYLNNILKGSSSLYLAGEHQQYNFYQRETDSSLTDVSIEPGGNIKWENGLGVSFYYRKHLNDLKFDYYKLYLEIDFHFKEKNKLIKLELENEKKIPDFIYSYYNSNHFIWLNHFNPVDVSKAGLSSGINFTKQQLKVSLNYYSIKNLTYFNSDALPAQSTDRTGIVDAHLFHTIRFGKYHLINDFRIQKSDKKEIMRLPVFSSYTSFYVENTFFRNALRAQFGFDLRYCTKYFADAYMPATGQFYLQDEKEIGNYPYVDLFANFAISHAKIFFKLEHVNEGMSGKKYYLIPHYPVAGRLFKFGVEWNFYD